MFAFVPAHALDEVVDRLVAQRLPVIAHDLEQPPRGRLARRVALDRLGALEPALLGPAADVELLGPDGVEDGLVAARQGFGAQAQRLQALPEDMAFEQDLGLVADEALAVGLDLVDRLQRRQLDVELGGGFDEVGIADEALRHRLLRVAGLRQQGGPGLLAHRTVSHEVILALELDHRALGGVVEVAAGLVQELELDQQRLQARHAIALGRAALERGRGRVAGLDLQNHGDRPVALGQRYRLGHRRRLRRRREHGHGVGGPVAGVAHEALRRERAALACAPAVARIQTLPEGAQGFELGHRLHQVVAGIAGAEEVERDGALAQVRAVHRLLAPGADEGALCLGRALELAADDDEACPVGLVEQAAQVLEEGRLFVEQAHLASPALLLCSAASRLLDLAALP